MSTPRTPRVGRVCCPYCGKYITPKANGMLRLHGTRDEWCLGAFRDAYLLPDPITAEQ